MTKTDIIILDVQKFFEELNTYKHYFEICFNEQERLAQLIQEKHDEISKDFDYENYDDGMVWSRAHKDVLGSDEVWITEHVLIVVGGYCIIIYHAFERFLEEIFHYCSKQKLPELLKHSISKKQKETIEKIIKNNKLNTFIEFCEIFPEVKNFTCYSKIVELNVICNVFKHGAGESLERLKVIQPDITRHLEDFLSHPLRPFRNLDLTIEKTIFYDYFSSLKGFLSEILNVGDILNAE